MKTTAKFVFLTILLCLSTEMLNAQSVSFTYDAAGNRINRIIGMPPVAASALSPDTTQNKQIVYSEVISDIVIRIYPNPTDGLIKVEILNLPLKKTADILLYQFNGTLFLKKQNVSSSAELNITGQPAGVYILKIIVGDKKTEWKIIKK
jgi:hypothetical protein